MQKHAGKSAPAGTAEEAITTRRCVRRFLSDPVARETVERILAVAARAPSGSNIQPWKVRVLAGEARQRLCDAVLHAHETEPEKHDYSYHYYPPEVPEPYLSRRRALGWGLYGLLGIQRGEKEKMKAQHGRNYLFFDAPVGLIFTIDRVLEQGSWLDYGMFLQNIMVAARGEGLDTCPQAAWVKYHRIVRAELEIPETQEIVCGRAVGYADPEAIEHTFETEREPVPEVASFEGF
jgi:nitroreductase